MGYNKYHTGLQEEQSTLGVKPIAKYCTQCCKSGLFSTKNNCCEVLFEQQTVDGVTICNTILVLAGNDR